MKAVKAANHDRDYEIQWTMSDLYWGCHAETVQQSDTNCISTHERFGYFCHFPCEAKMVQWHSLVKTHTIWRYVYFQGHLLGVERGSSAVKRRTRNQVSPGSNPPLIGLLFRRLGIFVLSIDASVDSAVYLATDSGGNVSDLVLARNCCLARMLPGETENGVGMNSSPGGGAKSVKRFERSNGLDAPLYKKKL